MTRNVTRILVPTDFSEPSDAALEYAGTLAGKLGASPLSGWVLEYSLASSAWAAVFSLFRRWCCCSDCPCRTLLVRL